MAGLTVAAIRKVIQELVTPDMQVIKDRLATLEGDIKSLHVEIRRLDDKIDNGLTLVRTEIAHLNKRLDEALEIRERLAALEAKVSH